MGERRAASRRRSRKFLCGPWSCGGCSAASGACRCYSSSGGCCGGGGGGGGGFWPRPPTPRLPCLHGSVGSYRRLIHGFEDVLRRRLRGHLRTSRLSPSIKSGIIITTQKPSTQECDTLSQRHKQKMKGDTVNVRRSVRVKTKVPWMPPGKTSCRESSYKWEGPTHRLEITPPDSDKLLSVLRLSDLSTDEEDAIHCKMNKYEKKIDSLLNVVGTLKNEVKCQPKIVGTGCVAKRLLEEQKDELDEVTQELVETEHENTVLRRNIERMKEEKDLSILQKRHLLHEKECLMSKLVEAELDGAAASKQIQALKDVIGKLKTEKNMTVSDISTLTRQKELLLQKLSTFEDTNRTLRDLLREQHSREKDSQKLTEQQATLMKRLTDSDTEKAQLVKKLQDKEKEVDDLLIQIQTEKDQAKTAAELSKSMEAVRGHLQAQLRNKEAENHRLGIQIRNLERVAAQHKAEVENIMEQLKELKAKGDRDKDALKKAIKAQKERAERAEEFADQLNVQLAEKDAYVAEALSTLESWRNRYNQVVKDKSDLEVEIVMLNSRISELLEQQNAMEDKMREDRDALVDKLHKQVTESTAVKLENERLKTSMIPVEERLNQAQQEVSKLKASLKNYEGLIETYKNQVVKTRMEADEVTVKLELCDKENKALKEEMAKEIENARKQFQSQVAELEKLPEILKITETKLAECQEQLKSYEKKNMDLSAMITDLRQRIELQGDKMELTREKYQSAQEENKQLTLKLEEMERKLEATSGQNVEFLQIIAKREESIHQAQLRLEEKTRECGSLARQLEMAIDDAKKQLEQTRDRAAVRERTAQSKMLDLETQLSKTKTELNQLRRGKDDAERRFQSRLQDLKDRLEQSESTNRSMQNYVQFLKSSYANVFGDSILSSSPIRPRSPL
ncbi:outer dense fiber protein 2 isoform X1 [Protobothrops mucrosquamatus]|uniref:outer dense fiber protein 2 isoform X1 n=1 Tax=Protobothrops mucrosquamatus TaxID=103944 RepID=UPI0010FB37D7|nr:outer dense fiber protein 2 isoform X1 [Protobothrops mucrosquamatus]